MQTSYRRWGFSPDFCELPQAQSQFLSLIVFDGIRNIGGLQCRRRNKRSLYASTFVPRLTWCLRQKGLLCISSKAIALFRGRTQKFFVKSLLKRCKCHLLQHRYSNHGSYQVHRLVTFIASSNPRPTLFNKQTGAPRISVTSPTPQIQIQIAFEGTACAQPMAACFLEKRSFSPCDTSFHPPLSTSKEIQQF